MTEDRKLLEPLATVVSVVLRLLMALAAVGVVLKIVHGGWGSGAVCVVDESTTVSMDAEVTASLATTSAVMDAVPRYCAKAPGASLHLLNDLGTVPTTVLLLVCLFLLDRLLQGASRDGFYTPQTASRLRLLGWWLLAGSLAAHLIEAVARAAVLADLAQSAPSGVGSWLDMWTTPYLALLVGLGLITFARIARAGSAMRADLEGVV